MSATLTTRPIASAAPVERVIGGLFAVIWLVSLAFEIVAALTPSNYFAHWPWWAYALVALTMLAWPVLWWRLRYPGVLAPLLWLLLCPVLATAAPFSIMITMLSYIGLIVFDRWRWTIPLFILYALAQAVVIPMVFPISFTQGAFQLIDVVAVGLIACMIGWAIAAFRRQAELVAQLNTELTSSMEREKELVLLRERERHARDLHDGLGQQLVVLGMSLDYALGTKDSDPEAAWAEVGNARVSTAQALADMRLAVRAESPARPTNPVDAADWRIVTDSFSRTGLQFHVLDNGVGALPDYIHDFVHRLLQEGLTNAVKHGRATEANLSFARRDGELVIQLANNGQVDSDCVTPGFGLRSLTDRAAAIGGEFETHFTPGEGCRLVARIPLSQGVLV